MTEMNNSVSPTPLKSHKIAGEARGGRVSVDDELRKMISHQIQVGELKEGQTGFAKYAADGTNITRREIATAATVTLSDSKKALLVGTVALVMAGETYEVKTGYNNKVHQQPQQQC